MCWEKIFIGSLCDWLDHHLHFSFLSHSASMWVILKIFSFLLFRRFSEIFSPYFDDNLVTTSQVHLKHFHARLQASFSFINFTMCVASHPKRRHKAQMWSGKWSYGIFFSNLFSQKIYAREKIIKLFTVGCEDFSFVNKLIHFFVLCYF